MSILDAVRSTNKLLETIGEYFQSPFLLCARLFWGWEFLRSGWGKLIDAHDIAEYFASLGIPFPILNAFLAGFAECFGGFLLIIGLVSRLASIPLMLTMCVAFLTAESEALKDVFNSPITLVTRAPFTFLLISLIIFCFGPGRFSLDFLLGSTGSNASTKPKKK